EAGNFREARDSGLCRIGELVGISQSTSREQRNADDNEEGRNECGDGHTKGRQRRAWPSRQISRILEHQRADAGEPATLVHQSRSINSRYTSSRSRRSAATCVTLAPAPTSADTRSGTASASSGAIFKRVPATDTLDPAGRATSLHLEASPSTPIVPAVEEARCGTPSGVPIASSRVLRIAI